MTITSANLADQYLDRFDPEGSILLIGPMTRSLPTVQDPVIFVDGGSNWREDEIGVSVGDGDSSTGEMDIKLNPDKDFSDLAFAISLLGNRFRQVYLHGFLGGRQDHQLLNLGAVAHFLNNRIATTEVWFDDTICAYSAGTRQIEVNGTFSLIALTPAEVSLRGDCKYCIPPATIVRPVSSFGLSNIGHGTVTLSNNAAIFIFHNQHDD